MNGHIGVSIFFALSGYLITLLLMREHETTGRVDIVSFIKRRSLRIFPLYYLAIFFLFTMDFLGKANINNCSLPYALTYTMNFAPKACDHSTLSHFWSLSVEEHFYLFWPIVFLAGKRVAIFTSSILIAACIFIGTSPFSSFSDWYPARWTFPAMLPILAGCLTALIHRNRHVSSMFSDAQTSNIILVCVLAGLGSPAFTSSFSVWLISACSLLLYIHYRQDSIAVQMLEFKPLVIIGVISYGLYVWQGVFTGNGPYRTSAEFPPPLYTGLWITFIAAPLTYVFFERPLLRIKARYSRVRE